MKIAFAGKGGVGKTTLAAVMVRILAEDSRKVLAIDADPNSNLAFALGFPRADEIKPIVEMKDLIYNRMDIKGDPKGGLYKLNPKIDDIPEKFMRRRGNIGLIVMGTVDAGGSGCVCPESTFLRELLKRLVLSEGEDIVMDMEAGIEHLGRSTAASMDCLLIVAEPSYISIATGERVRKLAGDLKIKTRYIGNKVKGKEDEDYLYKNLDTDSILGMVPYNKEFESLSKKGSVLDISCSNSILGEIKKIKERLESINESKKVTG